MLFDESLTYDDVDRIKIHHPISEDNIPTSSIINDSLNKLNEGFYNESSIILMKETFSKTRNNNLFLNEAVEDFIDKFKVLTSDVTGDLDKAFGKFAKAYNLAIQKDSDFVNNYRDEFMSTQNIKVKMTHYTISDDIPRSKGIVDSFAYESTFNIHIDKIDVVDLRKKLKKKDSFYDELRANILGFSNKKIKAEKFKDSCWKVFRNGTDKPEMIELDPKMKLTVLQNITTADNDIYIIQNDLKTLKGFIQMTMAQIISEFNFVSKQNISKYEYDTYTSYIYEKINELRKVIKIYTTVFSYKMDAIKCRRAEYMDLFKQVVKRFDELSEDNTGLMFKESDYIMDQDNIDETLYEVGLNLESMNMISYLYGEDTKLFSEGFLESMSEFISKLIEMLTSLFNNFVGQEVTFDSKYDNDKVNQKLFEEYDLSNFEQEIFSYNENLPMMVNTVNKIVQLANEAKATDITKIKGYMEDVDKFHKEQFSMFSSSGSNAGWDEQVKSALRGNSIKDPKKAIADAYAYCKDETYKANLQKLGRTKDPLESILKNIDAKIKKAKANTNTTADTNKGAASESLYYSYLMSEEKSSLEKQKEANAKHDENNKKDAEINKEDINDKVNNANGETEDIKVLKNFFTELQKIQGYVWAIFTEGKTQYMKYLSKILVYEKAKTTKGKVEEKAKEVKGKVTKKEEKTETKAVKNGTADFFGGMMDMEYLYDKVLNESCQNISEEAFLNTLTDIMVKNKLSDRMNRDMERVLNEGLGFEKMTQGYTNLFSNKLNPYIQNKNSILYK